MEWTYIQPSKHTEIKKMKMHITNLYHFDKLQTEKWKQLEQLERLRSEIPPTAPWLPVLVIHIRSQVKIRQSQSYKFKKLPKIQIKWNQYTPQQLCCAWQTSCIVTVVKSLRK